MYMPIGKIMYERFKSSTLNRLPVIDPSDVIIFKNYKLAFCFTPEVAVCGEA